MTRLRDIRHVIRHCLAVGLAPEEGAPVTVYSSPPAAPRPPCVVIYPGGPGSYLGVDDAEDSVTWCDELVYYTLLLLHATKGDTEQAQDVFDDWLDLLEPALSAVAATTWVDEGGRTVTTDGRSPAVVDVGRLEFVQIPAETGPVMASMQVDITIPRNTH